MAKLVNHMIIYCQVVPIKNPKKKTTLNKKYFVCLAGVWKAIRKARRILTESRFLRKPANLNLNLT